MYAISYILKCFLMCLFVMTIGFTQASSKYTCDLSARYIDFESGNDQNLGTCEAPWKHHPWDANAKGQSRASHGIRTYIFKKGVTYRGYLKTLESGTLTSPIRLTAHFGWGYGDAVLSGAKTYSSGWVRCRTEIAVKFPLDSRSQVWCKTVSANAIPNLIWQVTRSSVNRVPIARSPNWKIADLDDPRRDWFELTNVLVELSIRVNQTTGFSVGERVSFISNKKLSKVSKEKYSLLKIVAINDNELRIVVENWYTKFVEIGGTISNGKRKAIIKKIGGSHSIIRHLVDKVNLTAPGLDAYDGAVIWAERRSMPKADAAIISNFNPKKYSIQANFHRAAGAGPLPYDRYYLEGLPDFLDSDGEYAYLPISQKFGILALRLPNDDDPNHSKIEVANRPVILRIQNHSNIEVSGLVFRFSNQLTPGSKKARHAPLYASAIQIRGDASNIKITHCHFSSLPAGVVAFPEDRAAASMLDNIFITDNVFKDIDGSAIALGNGQTHYKLKRNGSRLVHVTVQRNTVENSGSRTLANFGLGSQGNGIVVVGGEVVDVSGNQVNRSWGSGISVKLGAAYEYGKIEQPFLRGLIYGNTIVDSLLGAQDGGGINVWMGGPAYIYNNISGNPVGCMFSRHKTTVRSNWYRRGCYGVGVYMDGQYKGYVFNNILWGKNNNANDRIYNSVGLNEAMGFMHMVFNNTLYRFTTGLHKGMHQHNRNYYLANLFIDMGLSYIEQEPKQNTIDYATLAFTRNQFYGKTAWFGKLGSRVYKDLDDWRDAMRGHKLMRYDTGTMLASSPVKDVKRHDFMPAKGSPVIDAGVRVFVPWALYGVVGEWHFLRRTDDPSIINGENINVNSEWLQRDMFDRISRNDLQCISTHVTDFESGTLEDWIPGALQFDGKSRYCGLSQSDVTQENFDIGVNNFLIELVIALNPGPSGVLAKHGERGYALSIDADGRVRFSLDYGSEYSQRISSRSVDDSKWHHVLVEVDRSRSEGISIYLDGKLANGEWSGILVRDTSVADNADFEVGRSGNAYLSGSLDFLRISRGTLADAETTIEELYSWEFDGPFLRDFTGQYATGARRDVGAIEYRRN